MKKFKFELLFIFHILIILNLLFLQLISIIGEIVHIVLAVTYLLSLAFHIYICRHYYKDRFLKAKENAVNKIFVAVVVSVIISTLLIYISGFLLISPSNSAVFQMHRIVSWIKLALLLVLVGLSLKPLSSYLSERNSGDNSNSDGNVDE